MSRGPDKQFDPEIALAKAMHVFWARGYEAASLSELLEAMGVGRKSLYDTFGNKRSLFLKALEYYAQTVIKSMRDQLSAPGSAIANIEQVLQAMEKAHAMPASQGCMLGTNMADFNSCDPEMGSVLRCYLKQLEDAYCKALTRAQAVGEVSPSANPRDLARMILCTTQGMALMGRVVDDETQFRSVVKSVMALLKEA